MDQPGEWNYHLWSHAETLSGLFVLFVLYEEADFWAEVLLLRQVGEKEVGKYYTSPPLSSCCGCCSALKQDSELPAA